LIHNPICKSTTTKTQQANMTKADEIIKKHFTADEAINILQLVTKTETNVIEDEEIRETQRFYMKTSPFIFLLAFIAFLIKNPQQMDYVCVQTIFSAITFASIVTTLYITVCYFIIYLLLSFLLLFVVCFAVRQLFPTTF
jgi:hypothetical protein